jgi:hypothetical protein
MRWLFRGLLAFVLAWVIFLISPYFALYQIARAVQTHDLATIEERVDLRAVRLSLTRQLVDAYLDATGHPRQRGGLVANVGASVADPIVAEIVTSEALLDLLGQRGQERMGSASIPELTLDGDSIRKAWQLFLSAESNGFRMVSFAVPIGVPREEQFRLQLRLNSLTWRLAGILLPESTKQRLVEEIIRRNPSGA